MKRVKRTSGRARVRDRSRGAPSAGEPDRSRRRFLELLAAGSAAVLARPVAALAAPVKAPAPAAARAAKPARHDRASPAEIEKQMRDLAAALKTIRDFELPPGSNPSFVFVPLRARRGRP